MDISFVPTAVAASSTLIDTSVNYEARDIIRIGVSLVILVAGLCAVLFIIWGGVMLILSGGRDEKVKPAINSIRYAVIGVVVIILAVFVAPKIGDLLGLHVSDYLNARTIFATIRDLANRIFGNGSSSSEFNLDSGSTIDETFTNF